MSPTGPVESKTVRAALGLLVSVWVLSSHVAAQEASGVSIASSSIGTSVQAQQEEPDARPRGWRFRWDDHDHPTIEIGPGTYIDFRARLQVHARDSQVPAGDTNTIDLARRRVGVGGRVAGIVDFQIEGEIADDDPWRDVYADYREFDAVRVRVGHFKLPFSLDENTSTGDLDFVFRSRAANHLASGRDWGVMTHGRLAESLLEFEAGWFNHDGRNARTRNPERTYGDGTIAGRLSVRPFRSVKESPFRNLHAAIAWTGSDVPEGLSGIRGQTALDATFFPPDFWVRGRRNRTGLEARWQPGPFSLKAESIRVSTERREQSITSTDLSALIATGWYISGTWIVTGAPKTGKLDRPRDSILSGGHGNIEIAARIESLAFRSGATGDEPSSSPRAEVIAGNRDRIATFGVNWYPCRGIKVQANAMREAIANASDAPLPEKPTFWSAVVRFQLSI